MQKTQKLNIGVPCDVGTKALKHILHFWFHIWTWKKLEILLVDPYTRAWKKFLTVGSCIGFFGLNCCPQFIELVHVLMDWSCNRWVNNEFHVGRVITTITTMPQFLTIWGWELYEWENNYSFRFRSNLVGFEAWSFVCCWFSWKLPGHFRSNDPSIWLVCGVLWYPALASLNVATVALASLLDHTKWSEHGVIDRQSHHCHHPLRLIPSYCTSFPLVSILVAS